jgi:hypothetical protein
MPMQDKPENPREESAEWHRARAKQLRKDGYPKMADQHEQVAEMIEHRQLEADTLRPRGRKPRKRKVPLPSGA